MDKRFFDIKNPWRTGGMVSSPAIRRKELDALDAWLANDEVCVIYGPRRVGKSTLLLAIVHELIARKSVAPQDIFFFDLDTLDCADVLASPGALFDFTGLPQRRMFIFIDEIQRLPNPGLFLKGIHDLHLPVKLIVSGSSTLEIRSKVRETLSGRKRVIRLGGLSLEECSSIPGCTMANWPDYLVHGGYPAVVIERNQSEKRRLLLEYFESYLDQDIVSFLRLERPEVFRGLIRLLAFQSGGLVNLNELAGTLQVGRDTLSRYLVYLEETFVVRRLPPFARNPRKELTKMPKVYFADCGWRNLVGPGFGAWEERSDTGPLLEHAVEHWLRASRPLANIGFWRSEDKAEVDFVVEDGGRLDAFEVKAQVLHKPTVPRSLRSFIAAYKPDSATIINLSLDAEIVVENVPVRFAVFPGCASQQPNRV